MANERNLIPYKPGQSGNPEGGRRHNKELRALRKMTKEQVAEIGELILKGNIKKLQAIVDSAGKMGKKNKSVLITWFAAVAIKAIAKGDARSLDIVLSRIIGKVPESIYLNKDPDDDMADLPSEELQREAAEIAARLQGRTNEPPAD